MRLIVTGCAVLLAVLSGGCAGDAAPVGAALTGHLLSSEEARPAGGGNAQGRGRVPVAPQELPPAAAMSDDDVIGAAYLKGRVGTGGPERAEYVMIFDGRDVPGDAPEPFDRFALKAICLRNALRLDSPLSRADGRPMPAGRAPGYQDVVELMIARAEDPDPQLRHRAIRALGLLGDRRAVPVLVEALRDEGGVPVEGFYYPKWVGDRLPMGEVDGSTPCSIGAAHNAERAAQALASLNATEAVPVLTALVGDERCRFRATMADALGELGAEDAVPVLEAVRDEAATSGDTGLAYWCNRGILHIRARASGEDLLIQQLGDENAAAVYYSMQELSERGSEAAISHLQELSDDGRLIQLSRGRPTITCTIGTYAKWCMEAIRGNAGDQGAGRSSPRSGPASTG